MRKTAKTLSVEELQLIIRHKSSKNFEVQCKKETAIRKDPKFKAVYKKYRNIRRDHTILLGEKGDVTLDLCVLYDPTRYYSKNAINLCVKRLKTTNPQSNLLTCLLGGLRKQIDVLSDHLNNNINNIEDPEFKKIIKEARKRIKAFESAANALAEKYDYPKSHIVSVFSRTRNEDIK